MVRAIGRTADMVVVLGPYPLCDKCKRTNGGLVAVSHRQIHLRANGKEACVDQGLAGLMAKLWAVCDTRSCCEDENGRAYVVPTAGTREAAEQFLTSLGIPFDLERGILYFRLPRGHAGDFSPPGAGQGEVIRWRVDESGKFVRIR